MKGLEGSQPLMDIETKAMDVRRLYCTTLNISIYSIFYVAPFCPVTISSLLSLAPECFQNAWQS